jgi:hypothetical protein
MNLPRLSMENRTKLKALTLEQSQILPPGKVWFCQGRKVLLKTNLGLIAVALVIPPGADTICVSAADHPQIKEWIG